MNKIIITLVLLVSIATITNGQATESEKSSSSVSSTRWKIMSKSVGDIVENGLFLLMTGSPITSVKDAYNEIRECVGKVYDEQVVNCLDGPDRIVAASLLVLTDYRTWIWPPDMDVADDIILDVVTRRLKPNVRDDQCDKDNRPDPDSDRGEEL